MDIRFHIDGCLLCQARLRDERLVRVLLDAPKGHDLGWHLDEGTLAQYLDQKLGREEMERIDSLGDGEARRTCPDPSTIA